MALTDDIVQKRIAEETAKIKVDSYQKVASLGGWSGGGRGLWGIATVAMACGAMVGLVVPFVPVIITASSLGIGAALGAAASALPASVATFAASGLVTGLGGGLMLGRISGTAAAIAEEQEKRLKSWTLESVLKENPNAQIEHEKEKPAAPQKSFWQKVKDSYYTYINPRIGLMFAALGTVGALVIAAAMLSTGNAGGTVMPVAAFETLTGIKGAVVGGALTETAKTAFLAYTAGIGAAFGGLWVLNLPKITSNVTHFYGDLIGGRIVGREWAPPKTVEEKISQKFVEPNPPEPVVAPEAETSAAHSHVTVRHATYTELIAHQKQAEPSSELTLKR